MTDEEAKEVVRFLRTMGFTVTKVWRMSSEEISVSLQFPKAP